MHLELLALCHDSATLELRGVEPWRSDPPFRLTLDGVDIGEQHRNVFTLHGLTPDSPHRLQVQHTAGHCAVEFATTAQPPCIDVRDHGAVGDGRHDDTTALQASIDACPHGGLVQLPPGTWLSGPLFLTSRTHLRIAGGACLLGHPDPAHWPVLPATELRDGVARARGTWEGRPAPCHAALLNGIDVEHLRIDGGGTLDGNASVQTWWQWAKVRTPFDAWRPRLLSLVDARHVEVLDLHLRNAPSWTVHALNSQHLLFAQLDLQSPSDSPNTDGIDPESSQHVRILGCRFDTGDDCVAIKSGKPGGHGEPAPAASRDIVIGNCLMQAGHGAIVLGSECAGGVHDVHCRDCVIDGTDRGIRIKTRRGRGRDAVIAGLHVDNVHMHAVGTAISINSFYWCDTDGREPHVGDRQPRPVDAGTPSIQDIRLNDIVCEDVRHAAAWVLGLPEQPIRGLSIHGLRVRYAAAPDAGYPDMAEGIPEVRARGLYLENVRGLDIQALDLDGQEGAAITTVNCVDHTDD